MALIIILLLAAAGAIAYLVHDKGWKEASAAVIAFFVALWLAIQAFVANF